MKSKFGEATFQYGNTGVLQTVEISIEDIVVVEKEFEPAEYPRPGWNCTTDPTFKVTVVACPALIKKLTKLGLDHALIHMVPYRPGQERDFKTQMSHYTHVDLRRMRNEDRKRAKVDKANAEMEEWIELMGDDYVQGCREGYANRLQKYINDCLQRMANEGMKEMLRCDNFTKPDTAALEAEYAEACRQKDEIVARVSKLEREKKEAKVQERLAFLEKNVDDPELLKILEKGLVSQVRIYG